MAAASAVWKPRNILLAVGSARGDDRAVDRAVQLAGQSNAVLTLLHVTESSADGREASVDKRTQSMRREIAGHPQLKEVRSDLQVVAGEPVEQILAQAKLLNSDLIVMGVGHHDNLQKRLLGSTIDRVIRTATVPVLSVRSRAFVRYDSILVLSDFSPPSQAALERAVTVQPDSTVTVLHVCEAIPTVMAEDKLEALKAELNGKLADTVRDAMNAKSVATEMNGSSIVTALEFGNPIDVIEAYVAANHPQLVVVGTHGRTGFLRAALGSVAEKLLGILPCDVLVVGPPVEARVEESSC